MGELFTGLQHLLGSVLAFFYDLIPSFGISIILLTVLINLLLFPLTLRQTRATRSFQRIQPEIKRVQKELKDDKEKMQSELMRIQKEAGATPAGCLIPMLVQLPIWFALFRVFRNVASIAHGTEGVVPVIPADSQLLAAIQSGNTEFLGMGLGTTMSDAITAGLTTALPYVAMLVLMVAAQYTQQWYSQRGLPAAGSSSGSRGSQQVITKIMPLFIGFISWRFPAGLVLYWTTSNLVRIGQQQLIFRLEPPFDSNSANSESAADEVGQSDDKGLKGKPHPSSKKKKGRRRPGGS